MNDVLETLNHTTLEALGFAYKGEKCIKTAGWDDYTVDVFERNGWTVHINENGAALGRGGLQVAHQLSLSLLKCYLRDGII